MVCGVRGSGLPLQLCLLQILRVMVLGFGVYALGFSVGLQDGRASSACCMFGGWDLAFAVSGVGFGAVG